MPNPSSTPPDAKRTPVEIQSGELQLAVNTKDLPVPSDLFYANTVRVEDRAGICTCAFGQVGISGDAMHAAIVIDLPDVWLAGIVGTFGEHFRSAVAENAKAFGAEAPAAFPNVEARVVRSVPAHLVRVESNALISSIDFFEVQPLGTPKEVNIIARIGIRAFPPVLSAFIGRLIEIEGQHR